VNSHAEPVARHDSAVGWRAIDWLWLPLNLIQLVFTLSWSAFWITVALVSWVLTRSRRAPLALARFVWAPGLLWGSGARLSVEGLERVDWTRPHIFVANHQSMIDICALFRGLPVPLHFVVKRELARVPFLGWYVAAMGMIYVDRAARGKAYESVRRAATLIREGRSVASFPEGTRSASGAVKPFKHGVFVAAIEAGVPVVPVALSGTGRVLPPHGFKVRPGRIRVRIGEPVETAGLTAADRATLAARLRERVVELRQED
jgi:1-acyl-sn-glycerol-3-phosphate acyltransferase